MYVDQKREKAELLHELLKNGAGFDPLPVLTQVASTSNYNIAVVTTLARTKHSI
jgi:hypothetical protein